MANGPVGHGSKTFGSHCLVGQAASSWFCRSLFLEGPDGKVDWSERKQKDNLVTICELSNGSLVCITSLLCSSEEESTKASL